MFHILSAQRHGARRPILQAGVLLTVLCLTVWVWLATCGAAIAAQTLPQADAGSTEPPRLAVVVVGAGLVGVLLFGARLVSSRRSRRP